MCTRHTLLITEVPRVSKLYDLLDLSSRSNCLVFFLSLSSLLSMIITIILSNGEEKRREKNESNYALKFGRYVKNKSEVSVETIYDFQVRLLV